MAASTSSGFHDLVVVESLGTELWRALFEAYGWPPALAHGALDHEAIGGALGAGGLESGLLDAVEWIRDLGGDEGHERIAEAARELGVELRPWADVGAVELVARLAIRARSDPAYRDVLERAHAGVLLASHRVERLHEFDGVGRRPVKPSPKRLRALESSLKQWFVQEGFGPHVRASLRRDDELIRLVVVRGARVRAPLAFADDGRRRLLPYRQVKCDVLAYDIESSRLSVHAPALLVDGYRLRAGTFLFDDADHFRASTCSLVPLQEDPECLRRGENGEIESIRVTWAKWRPVGGGSIELSEPRGDVLAIFRRLSLPVTEGELVAVCLQFRFSRKKWRAITVRIRPPNEVKVPDDGRRDAIRRSLESVGIYRANAGGPVRGLWELAVGVHPEGEWRSAFGEDVDEMLRRRALLARRMPSVEHPAFPGAGRVLDVVPIDGFQPFYGLSSEPSIPGRQLTTSDVEGLSLDPESIVDIWRNDLRTSGPRVDCPFEQIHHLGQLRLGSRDVRVYLALGLPPVSPDRVHLGLKGREPAVVVVPRGRRPEWPVEIVETGSLIPRRVEILRAIVRVLGWEDDVDALLQAPADARLVVDMRRKKAWLDEVDLELTESPFTFVSEIAVAQQRNQELVEHDLRVKLAGSSASESVVRAAKKRTLDQIKTVFLRAGRAAPESLMSSKGGALRFQVRVFVSP